MVTACEDVKLILGGSATADFLDNRGRPVDPGTPVFLAPGPVLGFNQATFDANARQTTLLANVVGP
ncbi:MAG: hypothetical protein U0804_00060 [Gemmataceae bacterium]